MLDILRCKCRFADTPKAENSCRETDARSQQAPWFRHFRVGSTVALFVTVMPAYLADYLAEYRRLGPQSFVRAYPWPVLIVTGIGGILEGNSSRSGTMITANSDLLQAAALAGRVFPVVKGRNSVPGPVSIGRTSDNDLAIAEYTISTRHCILALVDGEYRLTDLGATNGTFINDVLLPPRKPGRLRGGETLRMGRFTLLFHLPRGFGEFLQQRTQSQDQDQDDFGIANKKVI